MKKLKFTHKIGDKNLTISYYQDVRLKKVKTLSKKVSPIYFMITYKSITYSVRSILWKSLMEANNNFSFGLRERNNSSIIEGFADIEKNYIVDKDRFAELCEYEFECIKRIIVFACSSNPETAKEIVNAYNFWGQDGLREAAGNILNELIIMYTKKETEISGHTEDLTFIGYNRMIEYQHPSNNAIRILQNLIDLKYDPVSLICFADEIGIDKIAMNSKLRNGYSYLMNLITDLASQFTSVPSNEIAKVFQGLILKDILQVQYGILYFPKIHFMYPIFQDTDKINYSLHLQEYISKD